MYKKCNDIIIDLNAYLQVNDFENKYVLNFTNGWIVLSDRVGYICKFETWEDCYNFLIAFNWGVRTKF